LEPWQTPSTSQREIGLFWGAAGPGPRARMGENLRKQDQAQGKTRSEHAGKVNVKVGFIESNFLVIVHNVTPKCSLIISFIEFNISRCE